MAELENANVKAVVDDKDIIAMFWSKDDKDSTSDSVNHPPHYENSCSFECIEVMEAMFGTERLVTFCFMNAFKYLWRFKNKNGSEDIKKAQWYLEKAHQCINEAEHDDNIEYYFVDQARDEYANLYKLYSSQVKKITF